jgi:hypothetical protein
MHQMAAARRDRRQPARRRQRLLGLFRRLGSVDVEVDRLRMFRVALQHALERRQHFERVGLRLLFLGPVIPRRQVDQRLGVERADVRVGRERRAHVLHRRGECAVERRAIVRRRVGVALAHRRDELPLDRRALAAQRLRLLGGGVARGHRLVGQRSVDVGPRACAMPNQAIAQSGSAASACSAAHGLVVVEAVTEQQPSSKRTGTRRTGGDRAVERAVAVGAWRGGTGGEQETTGQGEAHGALRDRGGPAHNAPAGCPSS